MQLSRNDQAEWDRMNKENAEAARTRTDKTTTAPIVTRGNTGR